MQLIAHFRRLYGFLYFEFSLTQKKRKEEVILILREKGETTLFFIFLRCNFFDKGLYSRIKTFRLKQKKKMLDAVGCSRLPSFAKH